MTRILLLLLSLVLLPCVALAQTSAEEERDRSFLSDLIEGALSDDNQTVRIDGFRGALSSQASVQRLSIADAEGEWLVAHDLMLNWTRSALFDGRLEVSELSAGSIEILRAPLSNPQPPTPEAVPFALPDLPVSVNVGELRADRIILGQPLIGQEVVLQLDGTASLAGGEGTASLTARRIDGPEGRFAFAGSFSNATRVLSIDLDLSEGPGGIAATLLNLPGDPSLDLAVQGTAPIDAYDSTLTLASDGVERVTGRFQLGTTPGPGGGSERAFMLTLDGDVTPLIAPQYREFFGPDVALTLTGRSAEDGTLDLPEFSIAAQAVRLSGSGTFTPGGWPQRFRLTGDLGLADGSPVLLPMPGDPVTVRAMTLDLGFDAARDDGWTAAFAMTDLVGSGYRVPSLTLAGGGTIRPAEGDTPGAFAIDLAYAATGLALDDPALAQAVGDNVQGQIVASRSGDGPLAITRLTIDGPGLTAALGGSIGSATDALPYDLTLVLDAADLARFRLLTGLDLSGGANLLVSARGEALNRSFAIDLSGRTSDLRLGVPAADALLAGAGTVALRAVRDATGFRIENAEVATAALTGNGAADLSSEDSDGRFDLVLDDAQRLLAGVSGPAQVTGTFRNTAAGGLSVTAAASLPGGRADFTATRAPGEEVTQLALTGAVPDLSAFAQAVGLDLGGAADLTLDGTLGPGILADLTLAARTDGLAVGVTEADLLLAGQGTVAARIARDGEGILRIEGLRVVTDRIEAGGSAAIAASIDASFEARIVETAGLYPGLSGSATMQGTLSRLDTGDMTVDLAAAALGAEAGVTGMISAAGTFTGQARLAAADLGSLSPLTGQNLSGAAELAASGSLDLDLRNLDLALSGTTTDLDAGIEIARPLLAGPGILAGHLAREDGGPIRVDGVTFATPGLRLALSGTVEGTAVAADLSLTLPQAGLVAPGLDGPASVTGTLARRADGAFDADLAATAPGTRATLTAEGTLDGAGLQGDLALFATDLAPFSRLAGRSLGGAIDLSARGTVVPANGRVDLMIEAATRNLDPGQATLAKILAGNGTVSGTVERDTSGVVLVNDLSVAFPNLTVTGDVEGDARQAQARFDARLTDLALLAPDFSGPATATGTARLSSGNWTIDAGLTGPGGTSADVAGTIDAGGRMALSASGTAPLGLANGLLEPRRIAGQASFDLRLDGEPALTSVSGTIRTTGATLATDVEGISVNDIAGTVTLSGGQARIALSSTLSAGGNLAVEGSIGLAAPFAADLVVDADSLALRDPELYETTATGRITLSGPLSGGALIAGTIALGPTEIQIPSSGVGSLGDLPDVLHVATPGDVARTLDRAGLTGEGGRPAASGTARPFALDLTLNAPGRVFVRGRGLDAELGGRLHIGGTTAQVVPSGAFELIRGRLDILQQRFVLSEGRADLQGSFVPTLDLRADTGSRNGTAISIIVQGPATAPEITFTSSPELPQDEVLAQLLFGRDLASITPLQAVQLAAAVGTLAGRGGGGLIAGIRTELGVDDFDVVTGDDGSAALRIGKYVADNVYTDVTIGAETEVNINLDLTRDVTVTGTVSSAGETSLGIYFERDY